MPLWRMWSTSSERMCEQIRAVETPKISQESERRCEQIEVIEVPKISRAGLESKRQLDEAELALEATRTPATPLRQTSDNA